MIIDFRNRTLRRISDGVGVDDIDFTDITAVERTGPATWLEHDRLEVPFTPEPDPEEQQRIILRLTTSTQMEEDLILQTRTPVVGTLTEQVDALRLQNDALARLVLRDFTDEP